MKKLFLFFFIFFYFFGFVSASHYVVGYVNDALSGEAAEGKTILLWNPSVGINENLIEIVGLSGSAKMENMYMFDCALLPSGCNIGDVLGLKVINNGDGYVSSSVFVNITAAGYDFVNNLTLNSFPEVSLNYPPNYYNSSSSNVFFNCSFFDLDNNFGNLSLYANFSGNWALEETHILGETTHSFEKNLGEGIYLWNCLAEDDLSSSTFGENHTLTVDLTPPMLTSFNANVSSSCGPSKVLFSCNAQDNFGIREVILESNSPLEKINYSMQFDSGEYIKELSVQEVGIWEFTCYSKDFAGNINVSEKIIFPVYSGLPEIYVNSSKFIFNKEKYIEKENVSISAYVQNIGCVPANSFNVSFFRDSVSLENNLNSFLISNLENFSGVFVNFSYLSFIGKNNIFVKADSEEDIQEYNESNNFANNSFRVTLWQNFYGNVSATKILIGNNNFSSWGLEENVVGNVFVTDKEAKIDWLDLVALGRDVFGNKVLNDFSDLDSLMGVQDFEDSVSNVFLEGGDVISENNFFIHSKNVTNVATVVSINSQSFVTGILWDASDDSGNLEFDQVDKEDIVFVTKLNNSKEGENGVHDYEISIPVKLRDYDIEDKEEVYFYYNLV